MVTPWFAVNVIGPFVVPELAGLIPWVSLYVPAWTSTVSPGWRFAAREAA